MVRLVIVDGQASPGEVTRHVMRTALNGAHLLLAEGGCSPHTPLLYKPLLRAQNLPKSEGLPIQAIVADLYGLADVHTVSAPPPSESITSEQAFKHPPYPWFWTRRHLGKPPLAVTKWSLDSGRFLTIRDFVNGLQELERVGISSEAPIRLDFTWAHTWAKSGEQDSALRNTEHLGGGMLCATRSIAVLRNTDLDTWH